MISEFFLGAFSFFVSFALPLFVFFSFYKSQGGGRGEMSPVVVVAAGAIVVSSL